MSSHWWKFWFAGFCHLYGVMHELNIGKYMMECDKHQCLNFVYCCSNCMIVQEVTGFRATLEDSQIIMNHIKHFGSTYSRHGCNMFSMLLCFSLREEK